jgi:hypothetical protein
LYNFVKFIEWPSESFPSPNAAINLCILGEDPFGDDLEQTMQDKIINGRAMVVQRLKAVQGLQGCHVLFVSASEQKRVTQILESLKGQSVLTVSEMERFAAVGGMINFTLQEGKFHGPDNSSLNLCSSPLKVAVQCQPQKRRN